MIGNGLKDIMKRKFKQRWSTIPSISKNWTTTSYFNPLNTQKTTAYSVGNPGPGFA